MMYTGLGSVLPPVMQCDTIGRRQENLFKDTRFTSIQIIQIDNFTPIPPEDAFYTQDIHFNHGETVANMLRMGGAEPSLRGRITLRTFNIGAPEGQEPELTDKWSMRIADVLEQIVAEVKVDPTSVDVVCIAQQNPQDTPQTKVVRDHIDTLLSLGIPVVVAAGNQSDELSDSVNFVPNALANMNAFVVQATQHGNLLSNSKPGNVSAEGRSTSFAAPAVAPLLGYYKTLGYGIDEIRQLIQEKMVFHNGSLPAAIAYNAYSITPTVPEVQTRTVVSV